MKKIIFIFSVTLAVFIWACGQTAKTTSPTGNWYGDSVCQIKDSPCKTEKVIYRIIQMDESGKFAMQADKIIDEKPEYMGTIEFQFDQSNKTLNGKYRDSLWKFTITGQEMEGTLILADGTLYRRIKVTKVECGGKCYDW
jgi:hypothetical protein